MQVALAEIHARPHLARVIALAANSGQRGSDLVRMRWNDMRWWMAVRHQRHAAENGLVIWVPFTQELMASVAT